MSKMIVCKACGKDIAKGVKKCVHCGKDQRNFFMKHKIITGFLVLVVIGMIGSLGNEGNNTTSSNSKSASTTTSSEAKSDTAGNSNGSKKAEISVVDFSSMDQTAIKSWADTNKVTCKIEEDYSDSVAKGSFVSQSIKLGETIHEGDTIKIVFSLGKKPSTEYTNALKKAETYAKTMHMSKRGVYDQLTSEYGEKFPADAAQYAVDNMQADWNANALEKAKTYQKSMSMSKSAIYDQLVSDAGEKFTASEAQYAIDHLGD
ncbi:MAG: Ltp family lipoprotein [Clostridiaceae bacterium]